jgi:hypothetical protein
LSAEILGLEDSVEKKRKILKKRLGTIGEIPESKFNADENFTPSRKTTPK